MSIKYQIAAVIFVLEAVMMTLVLASTVNRSQSINKEQFEINENVILELLADLSRVALFSFEYEELQPYIENISADPHVIKVLIIDRNYKIVASSDVNEVGRAAYEISNTNYNYWRVEKIENDSGILGSIAINFSNGALITAKKEILFAGLRIALVGMTIIAVVGIFTGYMLTRKLAVLSEAAKQIEIGNLDVRTNLPGHNEISHLGKVFDHMASSFKSTIQDLNNREMELKKIQDELEVRVEERTYELEQVNEELEHLATHDPLTNLPNRSLLLVRLNQAVANSESDNQEFAVIIMDLDKFKQINDTLGHACGDELLIQASARIIAQLRKTDTVARIGGDEFAIILTHLSTKQAINICEKICESLSKVFSIKGNNLHIGSSVGIAMYPTHCTESSKLLKYADMAMYVAKRNHKDVVVYNPEDSMFESSLSALDNSLQRALQDNELELFFQPKISNTTGTLTGVEALIRWIKNGSIIHPDEFIPYTEKTALIEPLTKWVLRTVIKKISEWKMMNIDIPIAANLSTRNLSNISILNCITQSLDEFSIEAEKLVVEITETSIMTDITKSVDILNKLDNMGVKISIDDFGTGYSSLMYLKNLPVDEIKIDRSFIVDIITDPDSLVIVRSIINLAHNLGIKVVAEGVESKVIWKKLTDMGCDNSQGYYLGEPMSDAEFLKYYRCNFTDEKRQQIT